MVYARLIDLRLRGLLRPGVWEEYVNYKQIDPKEKIQIPADKLIGEE
jgi:hypothetical protein